MPRTRFDGWIICWNRGYKLRLENGQHVFMERHNYLGPAFYRDRNRTRMIDDWWEDPQICTALTWFQERGNKA